MLKNKIIFITGASSGIGMACAKAFAAAGANLLLCARRQALLEQLAVELQQHYKIKVHTFSLDVQQRVAVTEGIETLPAPWQAVDVLINNAGLAAGLDLMQEASLDDWDAMIDTNVKGLLYITRAILPQMVQRQSGHIINIGSIAGHQCYPKGAVYCASKHAVNAITQGLRLDLLGTHIRVTSVDPGAVETNFSQVRFKGDEKRAMAVYEGLDALQAQDIADAVLYCASRPPHVNISEMIIMPTAQASATMVHRE